MRERAAALGSTLEIVSTIGEGTRVAVGMDCAAKPNYSDEVAG
jgi:nitrate/nitrite-specific signal transduction histidine kinase